MLNKPQHSYLTHFHKIHFKLLYIKWTPCYHNICFMYILYWTGLTSRIHLLQKKFHHISSYSYHLGYIFRTTRPFKIYFLSKKTPLTYSLSHCVRRSSYIRPNRAITLDVIRNCYIHKMDKTHTQWDSLKPHKQTFLTEIIEWLMPKKHDSFALVINNFFHESEKSTIFNVKCLGAQCSIGVNILQAFDGEFFRSIWLCFIGGLS